VNRRLFLSISLLILVLVLVAIAVLVRNTATQPEVNPTPSPTNSVPGTPNQGTMLVAVRDEESQITDAVVHGAVASTDALPVGSWLSLQPGLAIAVSESGSVTLSQRGPYSPTDVANEVANELGFDVDGAFILDRLAFAALVDSVGGVTVNSPVPIVEIDADGETTVLVKAGKRKLFGPAAADYVITLNPSEQQAGRMARFNEVWTSVLLKLPGNIDRVRGIVGSLGSLSRLSMPAEDVASILLDTQTSLTAQTITAGVPSAEVAGVGSTAIYTTIPAPTQATITSLFSPSILVPGVDGAVPRVRVYAAGAGYPAVQSSAEAFSTANLALVWGGQRLPEVASKIFVPDEASRSTGELVAQTLGLPATIVVVNPAETIGVQASVQLAADSTFTTPSPTQSAPAGAS